MAKDKEYLTPEAKKFMEDWERMTEAEREILLNEFEEKLRRHYEGRPTGEVRRLLLGLNE